MVYDLILISTGVSMVAGAIQGFLWATLTDEDALREATVWAIVGAMAGLGFGAIASAFAALGGSTLGV